LTEEKDRKDILIIGGIQILLSLSPVKVRVCVANATIGEIQLAVTVGEMEQTSEATQAKEGDEHSDEWLKIFSQEAEKEMTAALELATEGEEEKYNMSFSLICVKRLNPWREG
jgi:hypothetical protein